MEEPETGRLHGRCQEKTDPNRGKQQQAMLSKAHPVAAQMIPAADSPDKPQTDEMIGIHPLHALGLDGKKQRIQHRAQIGNGQGDVFSNDTRSLAGCIRPQDIAGKKEQQRGKDGTDQQKPFAEAQLPIGLCQDDRREMTEGEEKKQLAGIKMASPKELTERGQQVKGAGGKKRRGRVVLEGERHPGQNGEIEGDQAHAPPFRLDDKRPDIHALNR